MYKLAPRIFYSLVAALVVLLFALMVVPVAKAQTPPTMNVGLSWAAPTQYVDGTAIGPDELTAFGILCGTSAADLSMSVSVGPTVLSYSRAALIDDFALEFGPTYFCALTATTSNGLTSARSAVVSFRLEDTRVPAAPVLTVE